MQYFLSVPDLVQLIQSVFSPKETDKNLALIVDVPDNADEDNDDWRSRRALAWDWFTKLDSARNTLGLNRVDCFAYPNVHSNNADLPDSGALLDSSPEGKLSADLKNTGKSITTIDLLKSHQIILAPTEYSTTAPLKLLSRQYTFRAATMPGFAASMIPALRLDYGEINRRVLLVKEKLDPAVGLDIAFTIEPDIQHSVHFDLRFRTAHASGGRFPDNGSAGNLPSGEAYIVPYEGEREEKSNSDGILPVQFEDEIVLYRIRKNKACEVLSKGPHSALESDRIRSEPAYANIAEIGFGVLADFGVKPSNEILLDEKLGLHIAFGRSDHFGGAVGVKDFTAPDKVVHIDRIYIPEVQPRVRVDRVTALYENARPETLMKAGKYTIFK